MLERKNDSVKSPNPSYYHPKGNGWDFFLIDRSQEHDLEWVVFLDDGGFCWTFNN